MTLRMFIGALIVGIPAEIIVEFFEHWSTEVRANKAPIRARGLLSPMCALFLIV